MLDLYYPVSAVMWRPGCSGRRSRPGSACRRSCSTPSGATSTGSTPWIFPLGVLLGGLFAAFPIAILLHWLTNNLWTLVQQRIVFRRLAAEEAARPVPVVVPETVVPVSVVPAPA